MAKLIEAVPNFSDGRRPEIIDAITTAIAEIPGVLILNVHSDEDHNRAVVTYVCHPDRIVDAAFAGYKKAAELIDLNHHDGVHPRIGACDVCPLIPISDITVDEAVALSRQLADRVASELSIPVYLYEESATRPERRSLAYIRRGQFEGLKEAIADDPTRAPDFGPRKLHATAGATAVGVRFPLIAFNVFLDTDKQEIADRIARKIRASNGGFEHVRALGFLIRKRGQVQVSMNLTNFTVTPLYKVFDAICRIAAEDNVRVVSSEIVGLVPNEALLDVAGHYLQLERFSANQVLEERIKAMVALEGKEA